MRLINLIILQIYRFIHYYCSFLFISCDYDEDSLVEAIVDKRNNPVERGMVKCHKGIAYNHKSYANITHVAFLSLNIMRKKCFAT